MIYMAALALFSTALSVDLVDDGDAGIPDTDGASYGLYKAPIFKNADDCCSLTWEPLLQDESGSRFMPSTAIPAIPADESANRLTVYWARHVDAGSQPHVGMIDHSLNSSAHFVDMGDEKGSPKIFTKTEFEWEKVHVLSNPNNCALDWISCDKGRLELASSEIEYPSMVEDLVLYVRKLPDFIGGLHPDSEWLITQGFSPAFGFKVPNPATSNEKYQPYHGSKSQDEPVSCDILAIDCRASLRRELQAELVELSFDDAHIFDRSPGGRIEGKADSTKILSVSEMINDSEFDQETTIQLDTTVSSSLYMSHKSQLHDLVSTTWGVNMTAGQANVLWGLYKSGTLVEFNTNSTRDSLLRFGGVSHESHERRFKYSGRVTLRKRTKSKVTMKTKHIKGSHEYSAKYRIFNVDRMKSELTLNHVRNSLRRQGFTDWEHLTVVGREIYYISRGIMKIETGIDTHIIIKSTPLMGKSGKKERRRIMDLNQLPNLHVDAQGDHLHYSNR